LEYRFIDISLSNPSSDAAMVTESLPASTNRL
jgi:hypothetical protein